MSRIPAAWRVTVLAAAVMLLCGSVSAARETVDRVVAVVGNEVILASELANQMQMVALQTGRRPKTEEEVRSFQQEVLDQMVSDQLFLQEAKKDTSIHIRPEEVDQSVQDQIDRLSARFDTYDDFIAQLATEGLTVRALERRFRGDIRNQLLKQRFIQKKLLDVSVSRREVEEFYQKFKDSIPPQPEAVKLAHIQLTIAPSRQVEDSVKEVALALRREVLDGADIAALSVKYSSFGAGANGGDLGWISREDVVPDFARAAFALQPGDISGAIRTKFGYHVIKCEGKRGDLLHLRQILLGVIPTAADSARIFQLADSLLQELRQGADFAEMAKTYSSDDASRATGGELGWFATDKLPPEFAAAVKGWQTPGEYRGPVTSQLGVHILKLLDYQPEKHYTFETDYDRIKELARQDKTGRIVDKWIARIKSRAYIDYRLDDLNAAR